MEFTNTQRRLKQEAADRREAAKDGPEAQAPAPDAEPADGQGPDQPGG